MLHDKRYSMWGCIANVGFHLLLQAISQFKIQKFWPFNPVDKKTQAHVITPDGKELMVAKGAPQVVFGTSTA